MSTTISTPSITRVSAGNNTAPSFDAGNIEHIGDSPLLPAVGGQTRVPLIDGTWVTYANLDLAASAPALESVAARVAEVLPYYASVHRGAGYLCVNHVCPIIHSRIPPLLCPDEWLFCRD